MPFRVAASTCEFSAMVHRWTTSSAYAITASARCCRSSRSVRHGDARRPVLRLHEQRAVDDRVGHLLVRVAVDDQIDAGHLVRDARRRRSRSRAACRPCRSSTARPAPSAARRPRPPRPRRAHRGRQSRTSGTMSRTMSPPGELVAIPHHRARRRRADDRDLHAARDRDRPRQKSPLRRSPVDVAGEQREVGFVHGARRGPAAP